MVNQTRRTVLAAVGTGAVLSTSAAIGGADDEREQEGVRVVHLSPDAPPVDVYIDDEMLFENVEPFATQSDYLPYESGDHIASFVPTGERLEEAVLEERVELESGEYTLAAIGELCAASGHSLGMSQFDDDNSPTEEGAARIRAVHAAPDTPAVDVVMDGERLIEGVEFGEESSTEIPADEGIIGINEAGDDETFARFEIEPDAGSVYTGFGVGYLEPEEAPEDAEAIPFSLAIAEDAAPGER